MKRADCVGANLCLDFVKDARRLVCEPLRRHKFSKSDLGQVMKFKKGEDPQFGFDVAIHELLVRRIEAEALNVRLYSEENARGWSTHGTGADLVVVADPFDQSATSIRDFHQGSVAICALDGRCRFKACAIGDLNTDMTYFADESGARLMEDTSPDSHDASEEKVYELEPSRVRCLKDAWVVLPGMCQKRRALACRSSVTSGASRWLNLDGALNLARVAAGQIDAYLDPFVGQPIYEIVCAELVRRAGAVVTDTQGTPFDLPALVRILLQDSKARYPIVAACTESLHKEILFSLRHDQTSGLSLAAAGGKTVAG